ncbi:MAG: imidazolonepropionase-like amidohydrolase [Saprospiraceae bacterium]|jgi:imidazolonepropionase-like amidohydrolase
MRLIFCTLLFCCFTFLSFGQYVPTPAATQDQAILLKGATAHLGNGKVIENAYIAFSDGKLTVVEGAAISTNFKTHKVIDVTGKHVYPAFIAMNSVLGLREIGAVRATNDHREVGSINSHIRSIIAYNTDSEVIPTVRSNGVLLAQITPQGGRISGQSTLVQFDAWNWEDAIVKADEGVHVNWPRHFSYSRRSGAKKNEKYAEQVQEVETFIQAALAYTKKDIIEDRNLKLEAVKGLFDGTKKMYIHTNDVKSIEAGVLFAKRFEITPIIIGGRDSWLITDFLKRNEVAVVLNSTQSLPRYEDSDIDQPFKTPLQLHNAGVSWCFSHGDYWSQKNLPFIAGQAVAFGLPYEDAITALTASPAKIMGADKQIGTLEAGKQATLIVSEGDVLDMRTSKILHAFIDGREINLSNKHKVLSEKFSKKY